MSRIYRSNMMNKDPPGRVLIRMVFVAFVSCIFMIHPIDILANPQGGVLVKGSASISNTKNQTTIHQKSQKAIINWQSFNIGQHETTHFQQPDHGVALNRVNFQNNSPSQIFGRLTATGQIILINPAGIYFGPNAYVNVGGLIATTANISNYNFLKNKYHFAHPGIGSILNEGQIIAKSHGLVALLGSNVSNKGLIEAKLGKIVLATGNAFVLTFTGNELISFSITKPSVAPHTHIDNTGTLIADGGTIIVSSKTVQGVLDNVINLDGVAQARAIAQRKGEIILLGDIRKLFIQRRVGC